MSTEKMTISELNIKFTAETQDLKAGLAGVTSQLEAMKKQAAAASVVNPFKNMFAGVSAAYIGKQLLGVGKNAVQMAMDVVESESLFETSMGKMAGKAREWSDEISGALGLNAYSVRNNVGVLYNMTTSMGLADDTAYDLSTTLTGLAYDMASFYNLDTDEAFTKLRSGITGEAEPLKALGILVDENTVKQTAYKHGLAATGEELTQQQKVIGRYLAILDQTSNAQGDMARTIDSPANQMRRMKEEFNQAAIALGQALLPIVKECIPYVTALARIATEAISGMAGLTGTTVSLSSASGSLDTSNVTSALADISDEAENAESALKGATLGIDELNVLSSSTDTSDAQDMDLSGTYSYDLSTSGYNLIGDLTSQTDEAYEKVKGWLEDIKPLAEGIAAALAIYGSAKVLSGIKNLCGKLKDLKGSFSGAAGEGGAVGLTNALVGGAGIVMAMSGAKDMAYDLAAGTADVGDVFGGIVSTGGGIALAALALGPTGAIIAGLGVLGGLIYGAWEYSEDFKRDFVTADFFDQRGTSVDQFTTDLQESWKEFDTYASKQDGYRQKIEASTTAIDETKKTLGNLVSKAQTASEEELPGALSNIQDAFSDLRNHVDEKITNQTDGVIALLDQVERTANEDTAEAIRNLKTEFWTLQKLIGNEISDKQMRASEIIAKASAGKEVTSADAAELQQLMSDIASYAGQGQSKEQTKLNVAQESITSIDFGTNTEDAKKRLSNYLLAADNVEANIIDSYANAVQSITEMESVVKSHPELKQQMQELGYNTDTMFVDALKLAEDQRDEALAKLQKEKEDTYNKLVQGYNNRVQEAGIKYAQEQALYHKPERKNFDSEAAYLTEYSRWKNNFDAFAEEGEKALREETSELWDVIQSIKPAGYATGGMPRRAELFYAREDGIPELVGKIGSTTAVANNYQIEQGISDAVYKAMVNAKGIGGGSDQPLIIQIVDETGSVKAEQYISAAERKNMRDGRITIPLGV